MNRKISYYFFSTGKNTEMAFAVEHVGNLTEEQERKLAWYLQPAPFSENWAKKPQVCFDSQDEVAIYIGPNLRFETPQSTQTVAMMHNGGLTMVTRVEAFNGTRINLTQLDAFISRHVDEMRQAPYRYTDLPQQLSPEITPEETKVINLFGYGMDLLREVNKELGLGMDDFDMSYYFNLFTSIYKRNPTDVELGQLGQSNSSHSRHGEFAGRYILDGIRKEKTLFEMLKALLVRHPLGSKLAFKDNGGILEGGIVPMWIVQNGIYRKVVMGMDHTATAETHNHPTLISAEAGAETGVGGRERDITDIETGAFPGFGLIYFQTGALDKTQWDYPQGKVHPRPLLAGAIKGASGYGNPFGEPTLVFGHDAVGMTLPNGQRIETIKPIIYTGAVGNIPADIKKKQHPQKGMLVVRIGGRTYRIGVGGSAASSVDAGTNTDTLDFKSVQRGDPMMARCGYNVIKHCALLGDENPIEHLTDFGAGGASNALTELCHPAGATIDIGKMNIADPSMSQLEVWTAEPQEQHGLLVKPENIERFRAICNQFDCPIEVLGEITGDGKLTVIDSRDGSTPVAMELEHILGKLPQKEYVDTTEKISFEPFILPKTDIQLLFDRIAKLTGVCLPTYMVNTFDGSVGGRVIQGARDGIYQLPVNNYGVLAQGFTGTSASVGTFSRSNPLAMQIDEKATARMVIANALTTLMFTFIHGGISRIKARLNWMHAFSRPGGKVRLYNEAESITDLMLSVGLAIDGGKDSLSLQTRWDGKTVPSFDTSILMPYAHMTDYRIRVTPSITGNKQLVYIDLGKGKNRMGGSALYQSYGVFGNIVPDVESHTELTACFTLIQRLLRKRLISAGISIQKGGLITALAKMMVSTQHGIKASVPFDCDPATFLFNEEAGIVVECSDAKKVLAQAHAIGLTAMHIGHTVADTASFTIEQAQKNTLLSLTTQQLQQKLLQTSKEIEVMCGVPEHLAAKEAKGYTTTPTYKLMHNPDERNIIRSPKCFDVAILSAPGTNGEDELAYMFGSLGKKRFRVHSVTLKMLLSGQVDLRKFSVRATAGGFSFRDTNGSGKGFAGSILWNNSLWEMWEDFKNNPTLSFSVCNGFQMETLVKTFDADLAELGLEGGVRLVHNDSGRFEHRPVSLHIPTNTRSIAFNGLGGAVMPAFAAHAEGKVQLKDDFGYTRLLASGMVAAQYAGFNGIATQDYPCNVNGSPLGIAGLCTYNGQNTHIMPHIERIIASNNNLPYLPEKWRKFKTPIWQIVVDNMYNWLAQNA